MSKHYEKTMKQLLELDKLHLESNPKVLLLYLQMDYENINNTNKFDDKTLHLRPLLGLQYLVGAARSVNVEAIILDNRILRFSVETLLRFIKKHSVMLLGFYTSFALTRANSEFIRELRKHSDIPIIVGGPGYSEYETLLEAGADLICIGEGEATFIEVIQNIQNKNKDWTSVDGVVYISDDKIIQNKPRKLIDVNTNPWPVRDNFLPITYYLDYMIPGYRPPYITMLGTRGCPYRCSYCDSPSMWSFKVRQRTPDSLLEEIDYAVERWGVRYIDFLDDVFGLTYQWMEEFCSKLIEKKYDLKYKMLMNPRTFGKDQNKVLELCAKSGANCLGIGMQTADVSTLEAINRTPDTPEKLKEVVKIAHKNGIMTYVPFIVGFPHEPEDAPEKIIKLVDEVRPMLIDCYPLIYLKNTVLEKGLNDGEYSNKYSYEERVTKATKVKKHFYSSPKNLLQFFFWLCKNNPKWILYMASHGFFFIKFVFGAKIKTRFNVRDFMYHHGSKANTDSDDRIN